MSAISGSSRWVTQGVEPARKAVGNSTRRLPPPPIPQGGNEPRRSNTRRLPPPPLPVRPDARPRAEARGEEESDLPRLLEFAPGTHAGELARFAPPPTPLPAAPAADAAPRAPGETPRRPLRRSDPGWRVASGTGCRVCGAPLAPAAFGCRRCGEVAPRAGDTPSSGAAPPLPAAPPAPGLGWRRVALMGALACMAVGLPVTLFLEGDARYMAIGGDLLLGAMAGPLAQRGPGLFVFALTGTCCGSGKVALGTVMGGAALSWGALQTDPLLIGLLGATLFATIILGGLLSLASAEATEGTA